MAHRTRDFSVVALFLLTSCGVLSEDRDVVYKNHAEAVADGAFTRGWLPVLVPVSASEIHESYNLDTNEYWLTFTLNRKDEAAMMAKLVPVDVSHVTFPRAVSTARRPWWPNELRNPSDTLRARFIFLTIDDKKKDAGFRREHFVALDRNAPRAWCW